jgi:hypothetical protein
VGVKE